MPLESVGSCYLPYLKLINFYLDLIQWLYMDKYPITENVINAVCLYSLTGTFVI